jgi:arylsulfatase A-like enzyme
MAKINRREFMGAAAGIAALQQRGLLTRPNVLFILSDDLGYGDLSCYGRPDYKTPVLDQMAAEGLRFTDAYAAAPVCTPTRVGLLTGRFPQRLPIGLQEPLSDANRTLGIPTNHPTLSSLLKANNYETVLIGKWHLGNDPQFSPNRHGFEEFFGIVGGGAGYFTHKNTINQPDLFENDSPSPMDGYLTDLFTDRAAQFLKRAHPRPFYMSLHYNAPHWPWEGPADREAALKANLGTPQTGGSPEVFAEMMKSMDAGIGRVMQTLRDTGLERNTLVVFTSDNGGERYSNNWPFSFRKANLWEGGIRVPAIVRWPGIVPAGRMTAQAVVTMDWTATVLSLTGSRTDPAYPLDGTDIMTVCTGERQEFDRTLFWRNRPHDAARIGKWKYLKENNQEHLFDLMNDPGEKTDLKEKEPAAFARIQTAYTNWNSQVLPRPAAAQAAPGRGNAGGRGGRGGQRGQ